MASLAWKRQTIMVNGVIDDSIVHSIPFVCPWYSSSTCCLCSLTLSYVRARCIAYGCGAYGAQRRGVARRARGNARARAWCVMALKRAWRGEYVAWRRTWRRWWYHGAADGTQLRHARDVAAACGARAQLAQRQQQRSFSPGIHSSRIWFPFACASFCAACAARYIMYRSTLVATFSPLSPRARTAAPLRTAPLLTRTSPSRAPVSLCASSLPISCEWGVDGRADSGSGW